MPDYSALSAADKAVVQNTVQLIRAGAGEMAKVFNHFQAIADDTNATALVVSITAGDTIPNESGLAGSDDMTRTEMVSIYNLIDGIRTANDDASFRAQASKAAGINALLG